jgi:hypothetical protein
MMKTMKRALVLFWGVVALTSVVAGQSALKSDQSVYLLPMGNGFEQYLANQLTEQGVLRVVTDPVKADVLLTDEIGLRFEQRLEELYPPPPEEEEEKEEEVEESNEETGPGVVGVVKSEEKRPVSSFSRGRGNVFLVERQTGNVLWSIYHQRKNSTPKSLNKAAEKVVNELRGSMGTP